MKDLLPRARLSEVLRGRASLVGTRFDPRRRRGLVSPVEARQAMGLSYEDLSEAERAYLEDPERTLRGDAGVAARAAISALLAPGTDLDEVARAEIVSATVDNVSVDEAVERVLEPPPEDRARIIFFVHAHALNLARFDPELRELYQRADTVFPDGIGIRIAARILGVALRANVNGTDLLPLLCTHAAEREVPLVLVGGGPGVADECARALIAAEPKLEIPVVCPGYLDATQIEAVRRKVAQVGRSVVLVGMGTPLQERFAFDHLSDLPNITVLTVGGLFDFYSGRIPRAPIFWRELGLEWLWRLRQEPERLAKRYLLGNPLFLALALEQKASSTLPGGGRRGRHDV